MADEHRALPSDESQRAYFADQAERSNAEFWQRFGGRPAFEGRRVLDLGCGHGAMSLEMAREGARVVGVDVDERRIAWAQKNVEKLPTSGSMKFTIADVRKLGTPNEFDLIVSKDTFEHIDDVGGVLRSLHDLLAPGGTIWLGFSPLFYSPRGDHTVSGMRLPWAHTLPWPLVRRFASRHENREVRTITDLHLNGLTPRRFRREVAIAGLRFDALRYNQGDKRLMRALDYMRRFAPLERYATVSVYAVLSSA